MDSGHTNSSTKIELTTYDPATRIPICWKCSNRITQTVDQQSIDQHNAIIVGYGWEVSVILVGCKEQADIKNYEDAKRLCPLFNATE